MFLATLQPIILAFFRVYEPVDAHGHAHIQLWPIQGEQVANLHIQSEKRRTPFQRWDRVSGMIDRSGKPEDVELLYDRSVKNGKPAFGLVFRAGLALEALDAEQSRLLRRLLILGMASISALSRSIQETPSPRGNEIDPSVNAVDAIVRLFEYHLRFTSPNDQWHKDEPLKGRGMFAEQVRFFVENQLPIVAVCPAFPCKSSNLANEQAKVSGKLPDKGEELALRTLNIFVQAVKKVYEPGCHMVVVSDGHVFSDLVLTDDETVDTYNQHLVKMAARMFDQDDVTFAGLDDLLLITDADLAHPYAEPSGVAPVETIKTPTAQCGRSMLMDLFALDETIDERLEADPALMGLCRGFVTDDIAGKMSKSKARRVSWSTAKLMILRNEAYSRLVQLTFPAALRFSIHPHNNAGPKFAISLLHSSFRQIEDSNDPGETAHFHIPTPWHNVTLLLEDGRYALMKKKVLQEMVKKGQRLVEVPATAEEGLFYRIMI